MASQQRRYRLEGGRRRGLGARPQGRASQAALRGAGGLPQAAQRRSDRASPCLLGARMSKARLQGASLGCHLGCAEGSCAPRQTVQGGSCLLAGIPLGAEGAGARNGDSVNLRSEASQELPLEVLEYVGDVRVCGGGSGSGRDGRWVHVEESTTAALLGLVDAVGTGRHGASSGRALVRRMLASRLQTLTAWFRVPLAAVCRTRECGTCGASDWTVRGWTAGTMRPGTGA